MQSFIESAKEFSRIVLFAVVSWLLTEGVLDWLFSIFGGSLDPVSKIQLIGFSTMILRTVDKYMHEKGKETGNENLIMGLSRF